MNRPRRPSQPPPRRRPSGPPTGGPATGGPPRRRTPFDSIPELDPPFKVLGTGVDRQTLFAAAQPMELAVIQLITREIEVAAQKFSGRYEDFWKQNPHMIEQARKLDQVLALVQGRRSGA